MKFRTDIQALRGLAVLLVLLQHAEVGPFQAGYLGVDIFFVISGYLITRIIKEGIEQDNFSFAAFYFKRAKRLLPAAYTTFLVTALLSPFLLNTTELNDFAKQLVGAVTFTGNIALWLQTGYFEGAAELKPLLHVWSLAIEEQYYMLLPMCMVFIPPRYWLIATAMVIIASLGLCLVVAPTHPSEAFYLLPTRAWELALGSVATFANLDGEKIKIVVARLFWPALLALLVIPLVPLSTPHPGANAVIVCLATLIVILRRHQILNRGRFVGELAKLGNISYSLYLAHWPVFAFLNNAYLDERTLPVKLMTLLLAFLTGYLLYRYVERPCRRMEIFPSRKTVTTGMAASILLVSLPFATIQASSHEQDFSQIRQANYGFGKACQFTDNFTTKKECRNSENPEILVWGDSFAMHLVSGIATTTNAGIIQATRSSCGPILGLADFGNNATPAKSCIDFNHSVLEYLSQSPSVKVVVMSSPFTQYVGPLPGGKPWSTLHDDGNGKQVVERPSVALAVSAMAETVKQVRSLGKRIIIVAPPPAADFDIGGCLERKTNGKVLLGVDQNCEIPKQDYLHSQAPVLEFLNRLPSEAGVDVISFDSALCSEQSCKTAINGTFIYRDHGHLSYEGSRLLGQQLGLGERIRTSAR